MRLNWNNIGKGLEAIAKAKQASELTAAEQRMPGITEGAYGPELQGNIEQVRGLQQEAINRQIAQGVDPIQATAQVGEQYAPAIAELRRRQGLTQADYSVGSQGPNYRYQDMALAQQGLQRAQMEADVYRKYGDREMAQKVMDAARAGLYRAEQAGYARAGEERAQSAEGRAQSAEERAQALRAEQASAAARRKQLEEIQVAQAKAVPIVRKAIANARKDGSLTLDFIVAQAESYGLDPEQFIKAEDAKNTYEVKQLKKDLARAASGGVAGMNRFLSDKFDPDKTDNVSPVITQDSEGNFFVSYGGRPLPDYGVHTSLDELIGTVQGRIDGDPLGTLKVLADINKSAAQTRQASATADYYASNRGKTNTWTDKVTALESQLGRKLTPKELSTMFGVTGKPKAEYTNADVVALQKIYMQDGVRNPDTGKPYTPAQARAAALAELSGLSIADPVDELIGQATSKSRPTATGLGTVDADVANILKAAEVVNPRPEPTFPPIVPTTQEERLRGLYGR